MKQLKAGTQTGFIEKELKKGFKFFSQMPMK
jgi:hypothetical protein